MYLFVQKEKKNALLSIPKNSLNYITLNEAKIRSRARNLQVATKLRTASQAGKERRRLYGQICNKIAASSWFSRRRRALNMMMI